MKQEELDTTGPVAVFTSGLACGWIKRDGTWASVASDVICSHGQQSGLT